MRRLFESRGTGPLRRGLLALLVLALLSAPTSSLAAPPQRPADSPSSAAVTAALGQPATPAWPSAALTGTLQSLLIGFYNQEATAGTPYYFRAPEYESDKERAAKDPDTLWEHFGGTGAACHDAETNAAFIDCTGHRLARTFSRSYGGGLTLFDAGAGYYTNEAMAQMAGYYALYHAFARDFDTTVDDYMPGVDDARAARRYHERMVRAYEAHMRDIIARMFRDTRGDAQFQIDLTRSAGALATGYARTVQAVEEYDVWPTPDDRRDALGVLSGLSQRVWWEWVWPLGNGPPTAGLADLGSQQTYDSAIAAGSSLVGTDAFPYAGDTVPSLRPTALDSGATNGLYFDADYAQPGEWWCFASYPDGAARSACLDHAKRASLDGTHSPFGHYYGPAAPADCNDRAGQPTAQSCAVTNLGSIAEEWLWTFTGARSALAVLRGLAQDGDPDLPAGALPPSAYTTVTDRLGYGVSGWHGGDGRHDDLEWLWNQGGDAQAIRTLSGARHDLEMQDGRYSLGETASSPVSSGRDGDTWGPGETADMPGGIENHVPGANPLYGTLLFGLVLSDQTADGLSGSTYDTAHRNHPDEFNSWVWLAISTLHRCPGVSDPADDRCFAFSTDRWPNPPEILRTPLFIDPDDGGVPQRFRYLWRDPSNVLEPSYIAEPDTTCRGYGGVPWRQTYDWQSGGASPYLVDSGGFGAYNELVQALGGLMRVLAERHAVETDPIQRDDVQAAYYTGAHDIVRRVLDYYDQLGYLPDIENSSCLGANRDPGVSSTVMLPWQVGTGDSVEATLTYRAMWYSIATTWYWWYDSTWLDADPAAW